MAWMMDTYSMQMGYAVPEIVTGKPISIGGSRLPPRGDRRRRRDGDRARLRPARLEAGRAALRRPGLRQRRRDRGDRAARPRRDRGRSLRRLRRHLRRRRARHSRRCTHTSREHGSLEGYEGGCERITNAELLELPCDILVLAAREDQVTARQRRRTCSARLVAEGANGPTSIDGDAILAERGILVAAGHPHERRRRHRVVLRMGAGPRPALLGPRRDPPAARRQARRRLRPRLGRVGRAGRSPCATRRSSPRSARSSAALEAARALYP